MKTKALIGFSIILFLALVAAGLYRQVDGSGRLAVRLTTDKTDYLLGEKVVLNFELSNSGSETMRFTNAFDVGNGHLRVFVSDDGKTFRQYVNPRWGTAEETIFYDLPPGRTVTAAAPLLWNYTPDTAGLSDSVVKSIRAGKIATPFAFPAAGDYFVKFAYTAYFPESGEKLVVESKPVRVGFAEPTGSDLEIWKEIRGRSDFAYFLQEGESLLPDYKTAEREAFVKETEALAERFPDGYLSAALRRSLESYRSAEKARKLAAEKLKPND